MLKSKLKLFVPILVLFDGGGDGADTGGPQAASPESARRGRPGGELENVRYGIQQETAPDAGGNAIEPTSDVLEERRQRYRDLVNSEEYKQFYADDVNRIIGKKVAQNKGLQEQLDAISPVVDLLRQRYGIEDGDMDALLEAMDQDDGYWEQAADEAGMTVEQYKQYTKMERELADAKAQIAMRQGEERANAQLQRWYMEAEQVRGLYPSFDLEAESQNPQFIALLKAGTPVQTAFEVIHMEEIKAGVAQNTAKAAERQITRNIQARGRRPAESGAGGQAAFIVKTDVRKLTKADRAEIARRAQLGEHIEF